MERCVITITGKVQGVLFRETARQIATRLDLAGFARNEPDGSVYIEVEGEKSALNEFLKWCPKGSQYSEVENVGYSEHEAVGRKGFEIR